MAWRHILAAVILAGAVHGADSSSKDTLELIDGTQGMARADNTKRLLDYGATADAIKHISKDDLQALVDGTRREHWPKECLKNIVATEDLVKASETAALRDPLRNRDTYEIQAILVDRLRNRQHVYRRPELAENAGQLLHVADKRILLIIKQYLDYFDTTTETVKLLDSRDEEGGLLVPDAKGIRFMRVKNTAEERRLHYATPFIRSCVPHLGMIHTHPLDYVYDEFEHEKVPADMKQYAGPSGPLNPTGRESEGDTCVARTMGRINPLNIEIVITVLAKRQCNIDAYFMHESRPMVIDLGVYDYKEGKPRILPSKQQ